jgi:2-C-methyl-D-erythritol 4-phosphate cytidylyltransferase / 2-C-methyl-D-erythritol 2,4-cyclodiphosphate synthase
VEDSLPDADAIVVAAGASRRMEGRDKLMLPLAGRPLLAWTLDALAAARSVRRLILVAAEERLDELAALPWVRAHSPVLVAGGARRQESVAAGLAEAKASVALVHDGARPLVTPRLADRVALGAARHGAAIPVLPVAETLKRVAGGRVTETVSREALATAQTPQGARRELLAAAFAAHPAAGEETFTDEASLLEAHGTAVAVVPGERANIKVTEPADLAYAEVLLAARLGAPRVGFGTDSHAFGPGMGLALGGIVIEGAPPLAGHSDGDVALHAVADALLGAAAMGDLGRVYPPGDPATRGISSAALLSHVLRLIGEGGWRARSVDLTITGARPRLGAERLDSMRSTLAGLLGLVDDAVSVKASTGNLLGPEGTGRAIAASALVTIARRSTDDVERHP